MAYLIDTDIVIDQLAAIPEAVELLDHLRQGGIAISVINYMEVYEGVLGDPDPRRANSGFEDFLQGVVVLSVSSAIARRYAHLRRALSRQGRRVRTRSLDLIIAATALEHGLTLVSRNKADYHDVPGLRLY